MPALILILFPQIHGEPELELQTKQKRAAHPDPDHRTDATSLLLTIP